MGGRRRMRRAREQKVLEKHVQGRESQVHVIRYTDEWHVVDWQYNMAIGGCRCLAAVVELILLFATLCLSVVALVIIFLLKNDFQGECPLYPTIEDIGYFNFEVNDTIACNYIISANALSAGLSLITMIYVSVELLMKKRLTRFIPILKTIIFGILMVVVGVSAGILSFGFQKLCKGFVLLVDNHHHDYDTCKEWQQDKYWKIYDYDASHFYVYLLTAQFATSISAVMWVIMLIISFIVLVCYTSRSGDIVDDDQAPIII
eukprot:XP_003729056.1 PREDICTED: uncharacterized protein LOC100893520 [Strongylocentrotus purpuratus]